VLDWLLWTDLGVLHFTFLLSIDVMNFIHSFEIQQYLFIHDSDLNIFKLSLSFCSFFLPKCHLTMFCLAKRIVWLGFALNLAIKKNLCFGVGQLISV
jgi:hypothetical protein